MQVSGEWRQSDGPLRLTVFSNVTNLLVFATLVFVVPSDLQARPFVRESTAILDQYVHLMRDVRSGKIRKQVFGIADNHTGS